MAPSLAFIWSLQHTEFVDSVLCLLPDTGSEKGKNYAGTACISHSGLHSPLYAWLRVDTQDKTFWYFHCLVLPQDILIVVSKVSIFQTTVKYPALPYGNRVGKFPICFLCGRDWLVFHQASCLPFGNTNILRNKWVPFPIPEHNNWSSQSLHSTCSQSWTSDQIRGLVKDSEAEREGRATRERESGALNEHSQ